MRTLLRLLPAAAFALVACGDAESPRLAASVDTVDGVPRLSYPADPAGDLGWSLDTAAVLGDAFAEDAYQFDQVSDGGVASDADGNLYILDRQGGRVLKYSRDGEHLATYGRRGEGPGELNQPIALAVGPGDTIWVSDFSNRRFTGFPQDGGDAVSLPLPGEGGIPGQQLAALDDGFITLIRPLFGIRGGPGGFSFGGAGGDDAEEEEDPRLPLLALDGSLNVQDTLWAAPQPPTDMVQLEMAGRVMITMMAREFYPGFEWGAFDDGSVVVSDTAAYLLRYLTPDGALLRTLARAPEPRLTTEEDRELARQRVREQSSGGGVSISSGGGGGGPDDDTRNRMLEERLSKMTFAEVLPRIVDLRVDPMGRLWVAVSEDTPDRMDRIDIYDRDGSLLGELRDFPFPTVFLGPDRIGVLRRDELDVQQMVILDLNEMGQDMAAR